MMMLDNTELRVALVTHHIALRQVSHAVTFAAVEETIRVAVRGLQRLFGLDTVRVAVAGLNPHAGELTPESEERQVLEPVLSKLKAEGFHVEGPYAADTLFARARGHKWDLLVSPYHDQGLVAAKYPGLEKVVNVTLGLPFLRTSPGHGVAYDLVGKRSADIRSFERALRIAMTGRLGDS